MIVEKEIKKSESFFGKHYQNIIPEREYPCLQRLLRLEKNKGSLKGKNILINCHMTMSVLILLDVFINSGANIFWTQSSELVVHKSILDIAKQKNIYLSFDEIVEKNKYYQNKFDVVLDCGGYLANLLVPKYGFIELTQVRKAQYKNTSRPVVNVDSSIIKYIETSYGTGDGFYRSLRKIAIKRAWKMQEKKFIVFGFGKVGYGIVVQLLKGGIDKTNISIVEQSSSAIQRAKSIGIAGYNVSEDKETVCERILESDCCVTATGVAGAVSSNFNKEIFKDVDYLINMGTDDEWGSEFESDRIFYNKKPLNFNLEFPTRVIYLDPIFSLMYRSAEELIYKKPDNLCFSIQRVPQEIEKEELGYFLDKNPVGLDRDEIEKIVEFLM